MKLLDRFAASMAEFRGGVADVVRSAISGIGNDYQAVLLQHSPLYPPHGPPGVMQESTFEYERVEKPARLEPYPTPTIEPDR